MLDLARSAVFVPVCYQTMDMAMMPGGPMLIEINGVGGFDLPQLSSGRGFLTSEVLEFFAEWGGCGCGDDVPDRSGRTMPRICE